MSKENRDMSIEEFEKEYNAHLEELRSRGFTDNFLEMEKSGKWLPKTWFLRGYKCSQKEMQEKLDDCEKNFTQLGKDKGSNDRDYLELSCKYNTLKSKLDAAIEVIRVQNEIIKKIGNEFNQNTLTKLVDNQEVKNRYFKFVQAGNGCHEWIGSLSNNGYGQFSINNRPYLAHRISCAIHKNEFYDFMVVDHICKNRKCVNPNHLRLVTDGINTTENSNSIAQKHSAKTHCKNGHPLSGDNLHLRLYAGGTKRHRQCKTCINIWRQKNKDNKRARDFLKARENEA